jgi:NAD(P)-dependent dehydrogenase (short-subunit alcohol dehydrogenase family)
MANVLITGCSTGIGRATAVELQGRGHQVVATARRLETLDDLDVTAKLHLDVTEEQSILDAVNAVGEIDVLVNNAGFEVSGPVESVQLHEVRRMFETNYFGVIRTVQAFVPRMRQRGHGTIVNVSSVAGRVAGPLNGFYAGTKHALEALSDAMHYELGHFGIRTIVIEPGVVETAFQGNIFHVGASAPPYDELRELWDQASDRLRTGPPPGPDVVARVIADAIEDPDSPRRIPVGEDAELVIPTHRALDDAQFEATMRETLGLDW